MTIEHYLISKLADVMSGFGESLQEREAVGCMIRNRIRLHGGDWHREFTYWPCEDPSNPHDPAFLKCLWSAEDIFYNRTADLTHGAIDMGVEPRSNSVHVGKYYFGSRRDPIVSCDLPVKLNFPPELEIS